MPSRRMILAGFLGTGGAILVLMYLSVQPFPIFQYAPVTLDITLTNISENIWLQVSQLLWTERQIDLVVLAYLLLITASCCRLLLIPEEPP